MDAQGLFAVPQSKRPSRAFIDEGRRKGFTDEQIEELWFMSEGATPAPMPVEAPPLVPGKNMPPLPVPKPETLADVFRVPLDAQDQQAASVAHDEPSYTPNNWVPDPIERGLFGIRPQRQGVSEQALGASDYLAATGPAPTPAPVEDGYPYNPMQYGPGTIASMPQVLKEDIAKRALKRIESGAERAAQGQAVLDAVPVGPQQQNIQDAMQSGGVLPTLGAFARNPSGAGAMLAESIGGQPFATASGALTMVAPLIGAPLTLGAATQAEREASVLDQLQRAGVNTNDPQAIQQFAQENPGSINSIDQKALTRGAAIAAGSTIADLVSGGLGKTLVGKLAKDAAVGTAADASTEMLGQVITDGGVYSGPDVVAEAVLGGGQQIIQGGTTAGIQAANQNIQARAQEANQTTETLADAIAKDMAAQSDAALPEQAARNTAPAPEQRTENPLYTVDPKTGEITLFVDGRKPEQDVQPSTGGDYQGTGQTPDATPAVPGTGAPKVETLADVLYTQPDAQGTIVPGQNIVPGPQYQGSGQTPDATPTAPKQTPTQQAQEPAPATAPTASPAPVVADNATSQPTPAPAQTQQPEQSPATFAAPEGITPSPRVDLPPEQQPIAEAKPQEQKPTVEKVVTPSSEQEIEVEYQVKELSELTQGKGIQQNRDRSSKTSDNQLNEIYAKFDPTRLGKNRVTSDGAPIIDEAGNIEVGNGRTRVIERVYQESPEKAQAYRDQIANEGFSTEGFEQPVLVRVRKTPLDNAGIQSFVAASNKPTVLGLNANEQAATDAAAVSAPSLDLYMGGGIEQLRNRSFVNAVLDEIASGPERGSLTRDGNLTQEAFRRVRAAMLQKAYDGGLVIEEMFDNENTDVKGLGNAMIDAAPIVAQLRNDIEAGRIDPKYDIGPDVNEALEVMKGIRHRMRTEGVNYADAVKQLSFLEASPKAQQIAEAFYKATENRPMSRQAVADFLTDYAMEARQQNANEELSKNQSPEDILTRAREKQLEAHDKGYAGNPADQGVLLKKVPGTGEGNGAGTGSLDKRAKSASSPNIVSRQGIARRSGESGVRHLFDISSGDWNAMGIGSKLKKVQQALKREFGFVMVANSRKLSKQIILDQALEMYGNLDAMSDILGISRSAMSLNGKIGLAFQGEPKAGVIGRFTFKKNRNSTAYISSINRNNSFAHEWWHALDNYLVGQVKGKLLSETLPNRRRRQNNPSLAIKQAYSELIMSLFEADDARRAVEIRDLESRLDQIEQGGQGVEARRKALKAQINKLHAAMNTDIGKLSKSDMDYTGRIAEMTARAFEATIAQWMHVNADLGPGNGIVYEGVLNEESVLEAYPSDRDRGAIDAAFKRLFSEMMGEGILQAMGNQRPLPRETTTTEDISSLLPDIPDPYFYDAQIEADKMNEEAKAAKRDEITRLKNSLTTQQKANRARAFGETDVSSAAGGVKRAIAINLDLRGRLLALRRLGGRSKKLTSVIDSLVDAPGSGRNQRVVLHQARDKISQQYANIVAKALKKAKPEGAEKDFMYDALDDPNFNWSRVPTDMRETLKKKVAIVRETLTDLLARQNYVVNAETNSQIGPNIQATDSYVPGVYDMDKIAADLDGYERAMALDYEDDIKQRLQSNQPITGQNGILTAAEAERFSVSEPEDLTETVIRNIAKDRGQAARFGVSVEAGASTFTAGISHTKSRALLPTARKNSKQYRVTDIEQLLRGYAANAAEVSAWYRAVGPGVTKSGDIIQPRENLERRISEGVAEISDLTTRGDRARAVEMLRYAGGLEAGQTNPIVENIHQAITAAMLVRAVWQQVTEPATMILLDGDLAGYTTHIGKQILAIAEHAKHLVGIKRLSYNEYMTEMGAAAGLGVDLQMSMLHAARAGMDVEASKGSEGPLAKYAQAGYRYIGMTGHMMLMQRIGAVHAYRRLHMFAKKGEGLRDVYKQELKDYGLWDDWQEISQEVLRLGRNVDPIELQKSKHGEKITDGMFVYVKNHFLEPTRLDKPFYASKAMMGRLMWSLMSYSQAFHSRVQKVAIKRMNQLERSGASKAAIASAMMGTRLAGYIIFGVVVNRVLQVLANFDLDKLDDISKHEDEDWGEYLKAFIPFFGDKGKREDFGMEVLSYSDILTPLGTRVLEQFTSARYRTDPVSKILPPSASFIMAPFTKRVTYPYKNSENTDTAEWVQWRGDYNIFRTGAQFGSIAAARAITGIPLPNNAGSVLLRGAMLASNQFVSSKYARDLAGENFGGITTKGEFSGLNPDHKYGSKKKSGSSSKKKPQTYTDQAKGN